MWRAHFVARQCPKNIFSPQFRACSEARTFSRKLTSVKTNAAVCDDNVTSAKPDRECAKQLVSRVRQFQQTIHASGLKDLKPLKPVLVKRSAKSSKTHGGPTVDQEGQSISAMLSAFVEACDVIDEVPLAFKSFRGIHSAVKKQRKGLNLDSRLYQVLLRGLARQGSLQV
jgi:hypothetical protein